MIGHTGLGFHNLGFTVGDSESEIEMSDRAIGGVNARRQGARSSGEPALH
jgi:hypothetical protein